MMLMYSLIATVNAQIIYVKEGATGNGLSWNNPIGDLKSAMENASSGTEIWVASGTYYPTTCNPCIFEDRQIYFSLPEGVQLYGGFAGDEASISERNIDNNPTILSGNIDEDDTAWGNSYTILKTHNVTNATIVDGFIFEDATADFTNASAGSLFNSGAGIFNDGAVNSYYASPIIRNCQFKNLFASSFGGAIFNDGGFGGSANPIIENCIFEDCTGEQGGGFIYNNGIFGGECSPIVSNCSFDNGTASFGSGGAIDNQGAEGGVCNPIFTDCVFSNNSSSVSGGAIFNFGKSGTCSPSYTNVEFFDNVSQAGGAVYNDGSFSGLSDPIFLDCNFHNNNCTNGNGAAVYNSGIQNGESNPLFRNCTFHQNESSAAAGAVFNNGNEGDSSPDFINCIFSENIANEIAATVYNLGTHGNASPNFVNCLLYRNTAYVSAAGIYNLGSNEGNASPTITNCTFYGNTAPISGAVYNNAGDMNGTANAVITNCIFWANEADLGKVLRNIYSQPSISYCIVDVADCDEINSNTGATLNCGAGMIYNQYPDFVDTINNNFHLEINSQAIDAGNENAIDGTGIGVDLDGLPRIAALTVDMGPFEFGSAMDTQPVIVTNPQNQSICEGTAVSFVVSAASSISLQYQWQKNGTNLLGATSDTLTITAAMLADVGDYQCIISNDLGETISSQIAALTVTASQEAAVSLDFMNPIICQGESLTFTALAINGGDTPTYEWYVNDLVQATSSGAFTSTNFNDGDVVYVEMTASEGCIVNPMVSSEEVLVAVNPIVMPEIEIDAPVDTIICEGTEVTFTGLASGAGLNPTTAWYVNDDLVAVNALNYTTSDLQDGDEVYCVLTSNAECAQPNVVTSNILTVMTENCVAAHELLPDSDWEIAPNPSNGTFQVTVNAAWQMLDIQILDIQGRLIHTERINHTQKGLLTKKLTLTAINKGIYIVKIQNGKIFAVKKLAVN